VRDMEDENVIDFLRREIDALFARTKGTSLRATEWNKRGHAILDSFAATPANEADQELRVLRAAVKNLLPISNDQLPGDRVIPIYVRMDELRALHALAAPSSTHRGQAGEGE
jgi:hypothetical protein